MKPERFEYICGRLDTMNLTLPPDPVEVGYDGLAQLISQARAFMSESERYMRETLKNIHIVSILLNNKKSQYEIQSDSLLTDHDIKHLPNILDRRAAVNQLLKPLIAEIAAHEAELFSNNSARTIIRSKMNDLKGIIMDLKTMHRLLVDDKHSGAYYGSEHKDPTLPGKVVVTVPENVSVDDLISGDETPTDFGHAVIDSPASAVTTEDIDCIDVSVLLTSDIPAPVSNKNSDAFDIDEILANVSSPSVAKPVSSPSPTDDDNVLALLNQVQIPPKKDIVAVDSYDLAGLIGD